MAIDDSTSYELTGAQVKDLANKIKGKAADNIFVGATSAAPGSKGLVPQPAAGDQGKFLSGAGTWADMAGSYSTTEQKTPFTWIDGKTIYRKTINTGTLPQNGAATSADISSLSVDVVIDYRGMAWASSSRNFRILPFVGESMNNMLRVDIQGGTTLRIVSTTGSDWGNYDNSYVTLWYTKTTD